MLTSSTLSENYVFLVKNEHLLFRPALCSAAPLSLFPGRLTALQDGYQSLLLDWIKKGYSK